MLLLSRVLLHGPPDFGCILTGAICGETRSLIAGVQCDRAAMHSARVVVAKFDQVRDPAALVIYSAAGPGQRALRALFLLFSLLSFYVASKHPCMLFQSTHRTVALLRRVSRKCQGTASIRTAGGFPFESATSAVGVCYMRAFCQFEADR